MRKVVVLALVLGTLNACERAGNAAKETISKGGEVAGQAASEFIKGAKEGVEKTMALTVELDSALGNRGVSLGKTEMSDDYSALQVYIILERDLSDTLVAKAYDADGLEMGRARFGVSGKGGDAGWHTITFPEQTDLEAKGKVVIGMHR